MSDKNGGKEHEVAGGRQREVSVGSSHPISSSGSVSSASPAQGEEKLIHASEIFEKLPEVLSVLTTQYAQTSEFASIIETLSSGEGIPHSMREEIYKEKLIREVGPSLAILLPATQTAFEAYNGHMAIIRSFPPITTLAELGARLTDHPNYHLNQIINDADFARIFYQVDDVEYFYNRFPSHIDRVVDRILTNDADFLHIFHHEPVIENFADRVPAYIDRVINRLFKSDALFARIFNQGVFVESFCGKFPVHAARARELFLAKQQAEISASHLQSPGGLSALALDSSSHVPAPEDQDTESVGSALKVQHRPNLL